MGVLRWIAGLHQKTDSPILRGLIVLVLFLGVVLFVLWVFVGVVGTAAVAADLQNQGTAPSKVMAWLVGLAPGWPWQVNATLTGVVVLVLGAWLMSPRTYARDALATRPQRDVPVADPEPFKPADTPPVAPVRDSSASSPLAPAPSKTLTDAWERVAWGASNSYPGQTALSVPEDDPFQVIEIAPGNFQEVAWGGVTMRISYTAQDRQQSGRSAARLRIEAKHGLLPSMVISGGAQVDSFGQGIYRLPEGPADSAGERSAYYHRMAPGGYTVFVLFVDYINPQNGLLRLHGLFANRSKPIDLSSWIKFTTAPPPLPPPPRGLGPGL